jgi:hypothetical protein
MSLHEEISAHSKKQHHIVKEFYELESKRELFIEHAIELCKANQPFTVEHINEVTKKINMLAKNGIAPKRKLVTTDMVKEYVNRI